MFQPVLDALQTYGSFSAEELAFFESKLTLKTVPKKEYILKPGAVCQAIYFLLEGSAVHLLPSAIGTETVVNLYTQGNWLTDYQSFTSQNPAIAYIIAFKNCRLAMLEIPALHELVLKSQVFFKAGRLLEQMQYTDITALNLSPEERYRSLLTHSTELLRIFPLKLLASYLRITPETLSRIRARIS